MKKVGFLGIPGSFSFLAAKKYFKEDIDMFANKNVKNIFLSLSNEQFDYGVVPIENSTTGSILETYDELMKNKLQITGEIKLKIHHSLLVKNKNTGLENIRVCFSHPQAIVQCAEFLEKHSFIKPKPVSDTATAVQMLAKAKDKKIAAIAGIDAAKLYSSEVLRRNIEDNPNNFTRFAVVSHKKNASGNKASVTFAVKHIPGSLFKALKPYADFGLNLTKIESRPIFGKSWEYIFFIDFEIGNDILGFNEVIKRMKNATESVTILGIYNKGKTYET